jgi:regulator of nucleoside diphosphate kinase
VRLSRQIFFSKRISCHDCSQSRTFNDSREFQQSDENVNEGKISVLAPLGTAMLGYRVGDEFVWHVPHGLRRLKVTKLHFQPEASLEKAA